MDTWSGKAKHFLLENSFEQKSSGEGFRDGGGIMFTSSEGRGGAPVAKYADATPENIDALVAALSISGTALGQKQINSIIDKIESYQRRS